MRLYRVMSMSGDESAGIFYDATASLDDAVQMAMVVQRRSPSHRVTVEAENWPALSLLKYQFHRITGTHEGFGVNFQNRHGLKIEGIETVWPESAKALCVVEPIFDKNMNNEQLNAPKKPNSWDWIWPSVVGIIIVKLFGLTGGFVTIGAYYWLKPKLGTWGAVATSGVLGAIAAIGLSAMLRA